MRGEPVQTAGKAVTFWCLVFFIAGSGQALEPDEILVIANKDQAISVRLARYYCKQREVPGNNILWLSLGLHLRDTISRSDYEKWIAEPVRKELLGRRRPVEIRCLLTTYGVPFKVGPQKLTKSLQDRVNKLKNLADHEKKKIEKLEQGGIIDSQQYQQSKRRLAQLQADIDRISGKETNASVDSELSMVLFGPYDLYRWQPNLLKNGALDIGFRTLMVSRLDGPGYLIVKGLIDKAITAQKTGLKGIAYIDSRGILKRNMPGFFDQSLRDLAILTRLRTKMVVKEERTQELFAPGSCPQTAIYCGWYSLNKYIDAFDFVDGAVGYHISSFGAAKLHDPNSSRWCPAMLQDGITATLGAVAEPYLPAFPLPREFFQELFDGKCLVEAYYHTKPFNSWQMVLIGDPLYTPFKKTPEQEQR